MHPKNTTAPPEAQQAQSKRYNECQGFEYFEVQVIHAVEGFKTSYPGVLDEALAIEFKAMLDVEFEPSSVRIAWVAGWKQDIERVRRMSERMTDMIKSVRSAARPGLELRARLGQFGPYEGYAPQNAQSENVARASGRQHE